MTVKILVAGSHHKANSVLAKTVQNLLQAEIISEIFLATDATETQHLCQEHDFSLLILDETMPAINEFHAFSLSPATTMLLIVSPEEELSTSDTGQQGEYYIDYISQPLIPSLLRSKILSLLHIHHLKQELLSCQDALQNQRSKNHQCKQSLEQQIHYLKMLSVRDGLTGLFNRRHLNQTLEREILKARTQNTDLTMLLIDIDYFNETNRISGQLFGDSILNEFSARLTQSTRDDDICFRFGGSDFIVLLPKTDITKGSEYADKLRLACSGKPFTSGHHSRSVTVSIGLASLLEHHPKNQDEFINMADKARYRAKSEGRNRVIVYDQRHFIIDEKIDTVALLQETLRRILEKTKDSSIASIQILTQNVTGKHQDEHTEKATQYVHLLCERLGLPKTILETFSNALMLYNCFRLLLHRELLSKKEKFSYNDRKVINDLPYKLAELTQHFDYFSNERNMLLCQGEHYDGNGYPEGLAGEEIPLASRIFSLADGLAAMSSDRPHRNRLSPSEILHELARGAGTQWDPSLVLLTLDILREQHFFPLDEELLSQTRLLVTEKTSQSSGHTQ
ncbi:MAG: diguanylate cyclase [Proteobacteria bacterium]|jgi:diguanylate cyclase (GGDEF)-like protein|nr:diguanylate cyclase [Desulfocapsa sp.]MBU3944392.1 diguanylate cyclase [Pseudomonadota bacterium]MCG2743119.1 diguanylate cyclase [Desulfobacteraceae bacterium]MBU3984739.1 diguanylate cyclase [Pseudomonadota bacterium]MBU4028523.1 diguanylate cyclase [Pseudomonadota bacterium]